MKKIISILVTTSIIVLLSYFVFIYVFNNQKESVGTSNSELEIAKEKEEIRNKPFPLAGMEDKPDSFIYSNASSSNIVVESPTPLSVTGKEFGVIGKARGYWFFEGSFPVEILDRNGKTLARGIAQAQGEWMTEEFVNFRADIKIPESYIGEATLILMKDNPSGLVSHDASLRFPFTIEY